MTAWEQRVEYLFRLNFTTLDIAAPGVEILAAFSPLAPPSGISSDNRFTKFSILSGTSVASPHVAAAAAYIKSFHPMWSPSAIKSALMTTVLVEVKTPFVVSFPRRVSNVGQANATYVASIQKELKSRDAIFV
nr:subtilisin-like protease SBT4.3 [Tanacetum cinerariifolium]